MKRNTTIATLLGALIAYPEAVWAEDFAFFKLIKNGKVAAATVAKHCETPDGRVRALSTASLNLTLEKFHERVPYKDRQYTNVNFSPGEWNGQVYKAICPGLYQISVDFIATDADGATDSDVTVHIHLWRKAPLKEGQETQARPGELAGVAFKAGPAAKGAGHASAIVVLGTGDEISTHSLTAPNTKRNFERIELNIHRIQAMAEHARDYVEAEWEADRLAAEKVRFAEMPAG
ncbi:MAG: hypothetical protein FJX59_07650 [Alphaproteobacteria bacterium]|nr:hypothetical protein [Alphaproteobacteria bacterium]